jgi:pyrroloquinoline quinone biosynthesis protein B
MRLKILGSAAGGGFPQWNCSCSNCRRLRQGQFHGSARTQTQLAWQDDAGNWTLLDASPDLRVQIESTPGLWPQGEGRRSPIADVILTGAEVDQVLGLLLLREFHRFRVHATPSVRRILTEDNALFGVLARFPGQVCWNDIPPGAPFFVGGARLETLPLPASFPGFVGAERRTQLNTSEAAAGLWITGPSGRRTCAYLPGAGGVSEAMLERLLDCDVLLFDGTFWSDNEPAAIPGLGRTASQMGHLPISGPGGSLGRLASLRRPRRMFIHINNTNPILDEDSPEHRTVRDAGWEVAVDGMEIEL